MSAEHERGPHTLVALPDDAVLLPLLAGVREGGQPVIERVPARAVGDGRYRLLQGGLFAPGIASGDVIALSGSQPGAYRVLQRAGHLSVRLFARTDIDALAERLLPLWEQLGGWLEVRSPRALLLGIHVAVGFREIEGLLARELPEGALWRYGNVYDPDTGAPLGWWDDLLNP